MVPLDQVRVKVEREVQRTEAAEDKMLCMLCLSLPRCIVFLPCSHILAVSERFLMYSLHVRHTLWKYIYCVYLLHVTPCALLVTPLSDTHAIHMARLTGKRSLQCEGCAESCVGAECCECKAPISERRRVHFSDMVSDGAVAGAETGAGL